MTTLQHLPPCEVKGDPAIFSEALNSTRQEHGGKVDELLSELAKTSARLLRATELANELQRENVDLHKQLVHLMARPMYPAAQPVADLPAYR